MTPSFLNRRSDVVLLSPSLLNRRMGSSEIFLELEPIRPPAPPWRRLACSIFFASGEVVASVGVR